MLTGAIQLRRGLSARSCTGTARAGGWTAKYGIGGSALGVIAVVVGIFGGCAYETVGSFHTEEDIRKSEYRIELVSSRELDDVTTCMARALRNHTTAANEHPHAAVQVEKSEFIDTIALQIPGPLIDGRYRQDGTLLYLIENRANVTIGTTYRLWVNPLIEAPGPQPVMTEVDALVKPCL